MYKILMLNKSSLAVCIQAIFGLAAISLFWDILQGLFVPMFLNVQAWDILAMLLFLPVSFCSRVILNIAYNDCIQIKVEKDAYVMQGPSSRPSRNFNSQTYGIPGTGHQNYSFSFFLWTVGEWNGFLQELLKGNSLVAF